MIYNMRDRMPDLIAASLAVVLGLFTLYESSGYDMGSLRDMGPGYFPRILAIVLIGLGLALVISTLRQGPVRFGGSGRGVQHGERRLARAGDGMDRSALRGKGIKQPLRAGRCCAVNEDAARAIGTQQGGGFGGLAPAEEDALRTGDGKGRHA